MKLYLLPILLLLVSRHLSAQDTLTIDRAVAIALKNNYGLLVADKNKAISQTNNTWGNAGFLPEINASASAISEKNTIDEKPFNDDNTRYNNNTNALNAAIALNWGGKMFVTAAKLKELEALGEVEYKEKVRQTVSEVTKAYYDVVRQKQQLLSYNEAFAYNTERVKISQTVFNTGLSPKTFLLQAKIDLNVIEEKVLMQQAVIETSKLDLIRLLGADASFAFTVPDTIPLTFVPNKADLLQQLHANNASLQTLQKQVAISDLIINEQKTYRLPKVNVNAGYNFGQANNSVGNIEQRTISGPQLGVSLAIPIYQAGNTARQIKIARIEKEVEQFNLADLRLQLTTKLQAILTGYETQQRMLSVEIQNEALAKECLDIALQRLRLGQTTALEVRQAQENYVEAQTRLINFQYNLKVAETELKELTGML